MLLRGRSPLENRGKPDGSMLVKFLKATADSPKMSFPDLEVRNPEFTGSRSERPWPSIAQLEERGTVKETLCDPEVTGSTPVRRTFCLAAIFRGDDAPSKGHAPSKGYALDDADASMILLW